MKVGEDQTVPWRTAMEVLRLVEELELFEYCCVRSISFRQCEKLTGGIQNELTLVLADEDISPKRQVQLKFSDVRDLRLEQNHSANWVMRISVAEHGDHTHEGGMRYVVWEEEQEESIRFTFKSMEGVSVPVHDGGLC